MGSNGIKYGIAAAFVVGIAALLWRGEFYLIFPLRLGRISRADQPAVYWSFIFFFLAGTVGLLAIMLLQP